MMVSCLELANAENLKLRFTKRPTSVGTPLQLVCVALVRERALSVVLV